MNIVKRQHHNERQTMKRSYASVAAIVTLVFSMTGGALAASRHHSKAPVRQVLRGATGPTGPEGREGKEGPSNVGTTGVAGERGPRGPEGPTGQRGYNGVTGATGATGATGERGEKGTTGATGPAGGPTGPQGATGATGASGTPGGPPGPTGHTGATGATGVTGSLGSQEELTENGVPSNGPGTLSIATIYCGTGKNRLTGGGQGEGFHVEWYSSRPLPGGGWAFSVEQGGNTAVQAKVIIVCTS